MTPKQTPPKGQRFFDVRPPSRSVPSATSKPIIVGHRPTIADPTVRQTPAAPITSPDPATPPPPPPAPEAAAMPAGHPPTIAPEPAVPVPEPIVPHPAPPSPEAPKPQVAEPTKPSPAHHPEHISLPWWGWLILGLIGLLVAAYLLIDAGVIRGASHLPFHIFAQPTS